MYAMTAAHRQLPLPTFVEVTNLNNGRKVIVRVNDRGPFMKSRVIDLSYAAAHRLDMLGAGTAPVQIRALVPGQAAQAVTTSTDHSAKITYYLQAGAFSDRANADRLRARLDSYSLGVPSRLEAVEVRGNTLHRVRLGPVPSVSEIDRLSAALAKFGLHDAQVIVND
jgi:rare lipoprotein A